MSRLMKSSRTIASVVSTLLLSSLVPVASAQNVATATETPHDGVDAVSVVGLTVADLDKAVFFFSDVLTFQKVAEGQGVGDELARLQGLPNVKTRWARMKLGDEMIELTQYETPKGQVFPADSRSNDHWFQHIAIIVRNMEEAHAWLHEKMVRHASKDPQRLPDWNKNAAGIKAFYFRDLDGHYLEVLEFPPDKGNPKWHQPTDKLFLGIDHTAIVVSDTEASLRFYRDGLGFRVVGGSENYGMEQEDLNNVPGAHLRITTLRATAGPAIEFLEYISPRDGRAYPTDARPNDLLHWETTLVTRDVNKVAAGLLRDGARSISQGVIETNESQTGSRRAIVVRDPDGHALRLVEEK